MNVVRVVFQATGFLVFNHTWFFKINTSIATQIVCVSGTASDSVFRIIPAQLSPIGSASLRGREEYYLSGSTE
jgi:hypothetical protein